MALVCRAAAVIALGSASVSCAAGPGPREDGRGAATTEVPKVTLQNGAPSAAPAPSAPAAGGSGRGRAPAPPTPAGVDAARFAVLADVCAVASWKGPDGFRVGCRSPPPFDRPDERPDGSIREANNPWDVCILDDFYRGSFSGPGKDQAILGLDPGPDRTNDITPDSVVLAEHGDDGWRVVAVERDMNVHGCSLAKQSDRTLLVCTSMVGAYGDGSITWHFTLDFAEPAGKHVNVFAKLYETPMSSCMMGVISLEDAGVTTLKITNERFADTDGDGDDDLSFTLDRAHAPGSAALAKRAEAQCKGTPDGTEVDLAKLAGPSKRFVLEFKGEKKAMVPTAATKKLLDAWGKEAPEGWWNMVK